MNEFVIRVVVSHPVTCKDGLKQVVLFEKVCNYSQSVIFPYSDVEKTMRCLYNDQDVYVTFETHIINNKTM